MIPSGLILGLSRLSGYSSNTARINPLNATTFASGSYSSFRLPVNQVIDLHSLALHFDVTPTNGVVPVQASQLIQRMEVLVNGTSIWGGGLTSYSSLAKVMWNLVYGQDKIQEQSLYSVGTPAATIAGYAAAGFAPSAGSAQHLIVDNFIGFLGGSYQRYLDLSILGNVEIRILWENGSVLVPTAALSPSFSVANLELLVESIEFQDGWYQKSLASALSSAPLFIPYKGFTSFSYSTSANGGEINTSFASESIDRLYAFLRPSTFDTPGNASTTLGSTQDSNYFTFQSDSATHQFRVNTQYKPLFQATQNEVYSLTKNALNGGNNLGFVNVIPSQTSWSQGKFAFVQSLHYHDDSPLSKLSSGLNTLNAQVPIAYAYAGANGSAYRPFILVETTSYIEVRPGQQVVYHP